MTIQWADLAEHIGTLILLIVVLLALVFGIMKWFVSVAKEIALTLKTDVLDMNGGLDSRIQAIWREICQINKRQMDLRAELPRDYLHVDGPGYKAILGSLERIGKHGVG